MNVAMKAYFSSSVLKTIQRGLCEATRIHLRAYSHPTNALFRQQVHNTLILTKARSCGPAKAVCDDTLTTPRSEGEHVCEERLH